MIVNFMAAGPSLSLDFVRFDLTAAPISSVAAELNPPILSERSRTGRWPGSRTWALRTVTSTMSPFAERAARLAARRRIS